MPGFDINYESLSDLHVTFSAAFFSALAAAPATEWQRIATRMPSGSAKNSYPFLGEMPGMREWIGQRITRQITNHRYEIENRKFEHTFTVKKDELDDDAGGTIALYSGFAGIAARAVALHPDELVMGEGLVLADSKLCYDGQYFFDTDHPYLQDVPGTSPTTYSNDMGGSGDAWYLLDTSKALKPLIYQVREAPKFQSMTALDNPSVFASHEFTFGAHCRDAVGYGLWQTAIKSRQTLNETNFRAARMQMQKIKNDEGRNMGLNPTLLVCPRGTVQEAAEKLFGQQYLATGESNSLYKAIDVMVSNYLPFA